MPVMAEARARVGWEAVQKAQALAPKASPVEQALIAAVARRYAGAAPVDPSNSRPLLAAYVAAMKAVAERFPDDLDVATLYAEALMNTNPWKLWNADGTAGPGTPDIVAALQKVLARDPKHPGANHYWIHAVEASPDPGRALPSAEALVGMMPAAGHLEHMPAHILQRVGRYEEAAEANRKGAAADLAYLGVTAPPDYYPMYLIHNYQFLAASAAMEGRRAETIAATRKVAATAPEAMLLAMPGLDWSVGYLYDSMIRFGDWDALLKEKAPNPKLVGLSISWLQGQAVALAATGRVAEAEARAAEAARLVATVPADAGQGQNMAQPLYAIGQLRAEARIAMARRQPEIAINALREAAAMEDRLAYNEPSDFFFPIRHLLGAALLQAGRAAEAEDVYREDLKRNPENGWALFGLAQALAAQRRRAEAAAARKRFAAAWAHADVKLAASAY
jgi:tetratricopeptide (TPR) repeat protein